MFAPKKIMHTVSTTIPPKRSWRELMFELIDVYRCATKPSTSDVSKVHSDITDRLDRHQHSRSAVAPLKRIAVVIAVLLCARPLMAQEKPSSGEWEPLGAVPVDQAGSGRRGYI